MLIKGVYGSVVEGNVQITNFSNFSSFPNYFIYFQLKTQIHACGNTFRKRCTV
jgi:hypothetical protein